MKKLLLDIAKRSDFDDTKTEVNKAHVHLMVDSVSRISPLQIVRRLKQEVVRV